MIKLICPECRRENLPERIYCHDCGARLDRSSLAKGGPTQEDPKETLRRLRSMLDPQRGKMRSLFFKVSKVVLGSLVLATVIQMILPPDIPARARSASFPPQISLDLENASMSHGAASLQYTEEQVNAYLINALKSKQAALSKLFPLERVVVNFDENYCRLTLQRSLFGYSIYTAEAGNVSLQNGALAASYVGGSIGRLAIHPLAMKFAGIFFHDFWKAFDRERKAIFKMSAVEFHPQSVVVIPKQ